MKPFFFSLISFLFLFFTACSDPDGGSFIYHNVEGYTLLQDGSLHSFDAIAVADGKVLGTGTADELISQFPGANRIDGQGNTLLPGLIDAHAHVMGLGIRELDLDITGVNSLEETLQRIEEFAARYPEREWITGRGWNQVLWDDSDFPSASDLDQVVPDRPVYLTRIDGHAAWVNSAALAIAGIDRDTPEIHGGTIRRDESGDPTGILVNAPMRLVNQRIPDRQDDDYELALQMALEQMAKHGLTSVHDARTDAYEWALYRKFADQGRLLTRIYAMIAGTGEIFDEMAAEGPVYSYVNDLLSLRSVKISADGALGSRGAALLEDYHDDPGNRGLLFFGQEELNQMLYKGASAGFQMNVHAIGDAANRQLLNSYEWIQEQLGDQQHLRHRVEHAQVVTAEDIPRFAELNLIASMQPTHATSDMNMAEDRVGPERIRGAYAWQTFLGQGTVIAGGSDFPVEHVNPFYGLYSAVTRQDFGGMPPGGWYSEQRMSRVEALRAFTLDAAFAAHQEEVLGTLEPGKWADFIVVDRNFFEIDAAEIWQTVVLETWLAGDLVYKKE